MNNAYQPGQTTRRGLLQGLTGAGLLWATGSQLRGKEPVVASADRAAPVRKVAPMKITRVVPILTGRDVGPGQMHCGRRLWAAAVFLVVPPKMCLPTRGPAFGFPG